MGVRVLNLRDTVMRLLDEAANTPNALTLPFVDGTLRLPWAAPRPEDELVLDKGKANSFMHWIVGSDEAIFAMVPVPLTGLLDGGHIVAKAFSFMSNPDQASPWQPDGATTLTAVTTMGTRVDADGNAVTCKAPADAVKSAGLVNVEILSTNPDGSGDDFGIKLQGCYFTPPQPVLGNPRGTFETEIQVFGAISELGSFTTPINSLD